MFLKSIRPVFLCLLVLLITVGCGTVTETLKNADGTENNLKVTVSLAFENRAAPTVLIGHGSAGVTANHHSWARTIKGWGFNSVIIDHYSLRNIAKHTGQVAGGASSKERARDFSTVVAWVEKQSWHKGNMALIGFSQGGAGMLAYVNPAVMKRLNLLSSGKEPIVAAIGIYPSCFFESPPTQPRMPVLMVLGEKDDLAVPEYCMPLNDSAYSVKILSNATHSFDENISPTVKISFTHRYSIEAVEETNAVMHEFLKKNLD